MQYEKKLNSSGVIIWLICALFYTYELLLRTVLGTFQYPIMTELSLTPFSFAIMSTTAYLLVYCFMQVPVGVIAEQFGLKKSLLIAVSICLLSALAFSYVSNYSSAILIRMLTGFGSSFGFVCLLIAVYNYMPANSYGLFIGLSQFIGTLGPMMAAGPLNSIALKGNYDWRAIFFSLGVLGIPLLVMVLVFVKNFQENVEKARIIPKKILVSKSLVQLLRQKQIWLIALYSALVYFTLEYLSENEGKVFFELKGFSSHFSAYVLTIGWLGYAIGCPLLGLLSDLLKRRKPIMIFSAISCLLSMTYIIYFPLSKMTLMIAFFMLGMGAGGQSVGFAIMAEQCDKASLAIGVGFNNAMITLMSAIHAPIIGALLSYQNFSTALNIENYYFAFSYIIALLLIPFACLFFIKETYCRSTKGYTIINWLRLLNPPSQLDLTRVTSKI